MAVEKALNVGPNKIEIAYESFGNPEAPPVLLIMGVGAQMIAWNEGFIDKLVKKGLQVIRFDNRDVGLSTHFNNTRVPDWTAALAGNLSSVSYTLSDMAADTIGLLDALQLQSAHIVGASMGGFIAQTIAIEYPTRIRSLTSIMSTTGNMSVGQPDMLAFGSLAGPQPSTREEVMDQALKAFRVLGSPGYKLDETDVRERAGLAYDRCYDPLGLTRQAVAVIASGDRTEKLKSLKTPTLVIHGSNDKMCHVSGGKATANAIANAELVIIEGLGHNFPRKLWPRFASLIADLVFKVEG